MAKSDEEEKKREYIVPWPMYIVGMTIVGPGYHAGKWAYLKLSTMLGAYPSRDTYGLDQIGPVILTLVAVAVVFSVVTVLNLVVLAFLVVALLAVWPSQVLSATSHPAFIIPAIFIGLLLYSLRSMMMPLYSIIEIIVGVITIWFAILTTADSLLVKAVALMSGIYILIRGLDNFEKTIPDSGHLRDIWDRVLKGRDGE
jgi:hypothetical protein